MYAIKCLQLPVLLLISFLFTACGGQNNRDSAPRNSNINLTSIPNAVPKSTPFSKYGNPSKYSIRGKTYYTLKSNQDFKQKGDASWYGTKFHGRRTSSGDTYDMYAMTAAHKTLPLPSYVRVTNLDNGKQIVVKVNDRGPFHAGRIIDLSYVAALKLEIVKSGTGRVEIETVHAPVAALSQQRRLFVQVGAYSDHQNAQKVRDKLAEKSIESNIHRTIINAKKHIYRVRIGPFEEQETAGEMMRNLKSLGVEEAKVMSYNGD